MGWGGGEECKDYIVAKNHIDYRTNSYRDISIQGHRAEWQELGERLSHSVGATVVAETVAATAWQRRGRGRDVVGRAGSTWHTGTHHRTSVIHCC